MKVLVTGAAGFIGAHVCRALSEHPLIDEIVGLDDLSTGSRANLAGQDISFVEGSILDDKILERVIRGCDAVVHLAAIPSVPRSVQDPLRSHNANATGTLKVLEAARRDSPLIVLASSSSVYGGNHVLPKSEHLRTIPLSPYAVTKLATESYAVAYHHTYGLSVLALRLFNVFGPLQSAGHAYAAVIPGFISRALSGQPLQVHGDGLQTRDFTYVQTVATVIVEAVVGRTSAPQPVNLAFGTRTSLVSLIDSLEVILGTKLERNHGPARPGDVRDSQADPTYLRTLFPDVTPVPLEEGLRATVEWFQTLEERAERP